MATDPYSPNPNEEDRFARAMRLAREEEKRLEVRRLQETPADAKRRAAAARALNLKPSEIMDVSWAERQIAVRRQMELREKYPAIGRAFNQNPPLAGYMLGEEDELETLGGAFKALFTRAPGQRGNALEVVSEFASNAPGRFAAGTVNVFGQMASTFALLSGGGKSSGTQWSSAINAMAAMEPVFDAQTNRIRANNRSSNALTEGLLQGIESVPLTIGAAATRNPYAGAGLIGGMVGLDSAREAQKKGMSSGEIALYGLLQGGSEAAFEVLPMAELLKLGGRGFLSGFGRYMLAEVPGEIHTTTVQSFTDWAMLPENRDRTFADWASGLSGEYAQTVLGVLGGGTVTVTTAQGFEAAGRFASRRAAQREMAAFGKFEGDWLDMMGQAVSGSTLRAENPEAFANLMRDMATERGVSTVLVPGEAVRDYLQSSNFEGENDPLAPYEQAALEAAAAGNDIALPIETALTVLPGSKAWEALKDDMRLTAGGMSRRQAQALEDSEEAMLEEFRKQAEKTDAKAKKQTVAREARIEKIKTKLEEDGGFAPAEAARQAELLVARMTTRAARMGRDDQAVDNAVESLKIRQVMPPELQRAMAAQEQDMVVAVLRGNTKGATGRARAAAAELQAVLARQGWTPEQLSDEQLGQVIERLGAAGENDGREYRDERDGRAGNRPGGGRYAPIPGATTVSGEAFGPIPELVDAAERYAAAAGIELRRQARFAEIDEAFAQRLAEAYEAMEHAPNDPAVAEAYADMIRQTRAQYDVLVEAGFTFTFYDADTAPPGYADSPFNALRDLRDNKTMAVYSTLPLGEATDTASYGSGVTDLDVQDNPMLAPVMVESASSDPVFEKAVGPKAKKKQQEARLERHKALPEADEFAALDHIRENEEAYLLDNEGTLLIVRRSGTGRYSVEGGAGVSVGLTEQDLVQYAADKGWKPVTPQSQSRLEPMMWPDQNGVMHPVTANDLFRAVHDAFGHGLEGAGFRAKGEENAWQAHSRLFTGPALHALTSETRGQNSWVNFGPNRAENLTASQGETTYADQKTGLLPSWAWTENVVPDAPAERLDSEGLVSFSRSLTDTAEGYDDGLPERFAGKRATLRSVPIMTLRPGNDYQEDVVEVYQGKTTPAPPIVVEDGVVIDGNNRLQAAINRGERRIMAYVVEKEQVYDAAPERDRRGDGVSEAGDRPVDGRAGRISVPPVNEDGTVTLDHFTVQEGLTQTNPNAWGKAQRFLPPEERMRIGTAPGRTYFGIATGKGGYRNEFGSGVHPRLRVPVSRVTARIPADRLYDMDGDPDGLKAIGRALPKDERGKYLYNGKAVDGVSLLELLIRDAGYAGYWIDSDDLGLTAAVFEPVEVVPYDAERDDYQPERMRPFNQDAMQPEDLFPGYDREHRRERFDAWFRDSAVVNADGSPMMVFHATTSEEFDAFRTQGKGFASALGMAFEVDRNGVFFAEDPAFAEEFVQEWRGDEAKIKSGARIIPAFLSIQNPVDLTEEGVYRMRGNPEEVAKWEAEGLSLYGLAMRYEHDMWEEFDGEDGANFIAAMKRMGYDGAIMRERAEGGVSNTRVWVAFDAEQIKSATGNRGSFDASDPRILYQREFEQATWFYSALERAAESVKTERAPAAQWIATLKNAPGVKAEELEWTGIIDWLEAQTGPVDKSQVVETIQRGGIVVVEKELGNEPDDDAIQEKVYEIEQELRDEFEFEGRYRVNQYDVESEPDENGYVETTTIWVVETDYGTEDEFDNEDDAQERADELNREDEDEAFDRFIEYQDTWDQARRALMEEGGVTQWKSYSLAEDSAYEDTYFEWLMRLPAGEGANPDSSPRTHWNDSGVVIHVRGHRRDGADGKSILFLDEIQSDWHQQAASRFTDAKAEAVRKFFMGHLNEDQFVGAPEALIDEVREANAESKAHRAWPSIAKWLEANPSIEGTDLLQSVADANRGYMAKPDPAKIARLEQAKREASEALTAPYDALLEAISTFQSEVKPQMDQWLAQLDKRIEDAAQAEEIARAKWELAETTDPDFSEKRTAARQAQDMVERLRTYRNRLSTHFSAPTDRFNYRDIYTSMINADLLDEYNALRETPAFKEVMKAQATWETAVDLSNLRDREYEIAVAGGAGIPDAPFKDTWPVVAVKRMIAKAAAEGYDQIAWIKQGENNGGMDDDVDWFYGRNLPNMVNKLLKPYKTKVRGVFVDGLERPDTPESEAFSAAVDELRRFDMSVSLGLSERGFDDLFDRTIARLDQEIIRYEGMVAKDEQFEKDNPGLLNTSQNARRLKELEEGRVEFVSRRGELKANFFAAQEAYIPGLMALDERMRELVAKVPELESKADLFARVTRDLDNEQKAREYYDALVEQVQREIDGAQGNIEFHKKVIAAIDAAQAAGEVQASIPELTLPFDATDSRRIGEMRMIEELRKQEGLQRRALDRLPSFEEAFAAGVELLKVKSEIRQLERERQRMFELPTNLGFDITPELREAAASGFPLFQPDHRNMPRGRILFPGNDDQGAVIELFQGRDLSTLIHESSHLWLEELKADAADPNAPEQIKRDWQIVLDWFKANGHEVRDGIIPVGAHEMWARGGERYMREGKAPSVGLKRAFETFRSWLVSLYKTVRGLNSPITPEIREVFDRLLATDDEIAEARQMQGMEALFNTAVEAGMSPDEFANYQEQVASARAEAQGKVIEKVMADIAKRETRLGRERRRQIKDQVTKAAEDVPLFKALALLREERMDRAALVERFGEDVVGQLPSRVPPLYAEGGTDPEIIAEMAGFASAEDMVNAMVAAEADQKAAKAGGDKRNMKARFIDQMTDQAFAAQYGEPMSPEQMMAEAQDAVANERQGEVIASEIAALSRKVGKQATPYQMARQWARGRVRQGVYVAEASKQALERHRRAIAAAGREAEQALIAGDMEAVYRAKQKQMLSSALLSEAKAAHEEVEVARARMERIAKARTMKSVDQDYLEQAHALLEEVELKQRSQKSIDEFEARFDRWSAWSQARASEGHDVVVPDTFLARLGNTNWSRLPVEQLLGLDAAVKQVIHFGRLKQTLLDNKERRDYEAVKAEIKAVAREVGKKPPKSDFAEPGWWDSLKGKVASLDAALLKAETIFDWLDNGNPNGAFNRYVFRPIARAASREADMLRDFYARHKANLEAIPAATLKTWAQKINTGWMERKTGQPLVLSRQQVIAMALNWGNAGNRQRLTDGYGLSEIAVENFLMNTLTAEEWAFVQATWDLIGELWPEIAAMERRVNGVEPEKVEAITFNTPHGPMRGGYYPAIYNTVIDRKAQRHAEESEDLFSAKTTKATTRASSTKERAETVKRPILLDLGVITRHMGEVIHDITHREAVIQAHKLLTDPEVLDEIDAVLGREYSEQLRPWVKYVANRWAHERSGNEGFARFFSKLRANATVVGMGFRFTTMMVQVSGYSNSIEYVGAAPMAEAIAKFSASPVETTRFVREKSGEMRNRFDTLDRDINQEIRRAAMPGVKGGAIKTATAAKTFAFHGIGYMDMVVSVPTWLAAYNKALARGANEEQAIYEGDKAVRLSQGSGDAKDLAAVQRGTGPWGEALKLMTMFYSYMSAFYQRQRRLGRDVARAGIGDVPGLMARAWWLLVVPPLLSELLAGRGPDDDEDPAWWGFEKIMAQMLGPIPVVRDMWGPVFARITGQPSYGYRFTPAQGAFETTINVAGDIGNVAQGEDTKRMTRNVLELVGFSTGLVPGQLAASTQFLVDVGYGEQDPQTAGEWFEGLTKGKIAED